MMKALAAVSVMVVALSSVQLASAHVLQLGKCKSPPAMANFQPFQFEGLWHVIEIFSTTSDCMTMTFNRTGSGFRVTEAREFYLGKKVNLDHSFTNTGIFTEKEPTNPAKMTVNWPSNPFGPADVTVIDTDYNQFAVLFECQPFLALMRRTSIAILSRSSTLDDSIVQKVKDDLIGLDINVDVSDFDRINHGSCNVVGEADFNYGIDEDTFKFGGNDGGIADDAVTPSSLNFPEEFAEPFSPDDTANEVLTG